MARRIARKQLMHPEYEVKKKAGRSWEAALDEFGHPSAGGFTGRHLWRFFLVDLIIVMLLRLLYARALVPSLDAYVLLTLAGKATLAVYLVWMIRDAEGGWRAAGIAEGGKFGGWLFGIAVYVASYPAMHYAGKINFHLMDDFYRLLGWGRFEPMLQDVSLIILGDDAQPAVRLTLLLFVILLGPTLEEFAFRGVGMDGFKRGGGSWNAVVWTSILFGLYHFDVTRILPLAVMGFAMAASRHFAGSLWCPVALHVFHNCYQVARMTIDAGLVQPPF
jgi:membrane protease YdiL (CAAX protease family)